MINEQLMVLFGWILIGEIILLIHIKNSGGLIQYLIWCYAKNEFSVTPYEESAAFCAIPILIINIFVHGFLGPIALIGLLFH